MERCARPLVVNQESVLRVEFRAMAVANFEKKGTNERAQSIFL
jgi:hypothetical protein